MVNITLQALCQLTWLMALSAIGSSKVVSGKAVAEGYVPSLKGHVSSASFSGFSQYAVTSCHCFVGFWSANVPRVGTTGAGVTVRSVTCSRTPW